MRQADARTGLAEHACRVRIVLDTQGRATPQEGKQRLAQHALVDQRVDGAQQEFDGLRPAVDAGGGAHVLLDGGSDALAAEAVVDERLEQLGREGRVEEDDAA